MAQLSFYVLGLPSSTLQRLSAEGLEADSSADSCVQALLRNSRLSQAQPVKPVESLITSMLMGSYIDRLLVQSAPRHGGQKFAVKAAVFFLVRLFQKFTISLDTKHCPAGFKNAVLYAFTLAPEGRICFRFHPRVHTGIEKEGASSPSSSRLIFF